MKYSQYVGFMEEQASRGIPVSAELRAHAEKVYRSEKYADRPRLCRLGIHWKREKLLTSVESWLNGYTYCAKCFKGYYE